MTKINVIPMDTKACGYYRLIYPAQAMYNFAKVNIAAPYTFTYYGQDWNYTARICNKQIFEELLKYKHSHNVKFAIDYDDNLWEELPSYNRCNIHWQDNWNDMNMYLSELADVITCSTEDLANSIRKFKGCADKVVVIKNALDANRWRFDYYKPNATLNFFYAGSPTHWSNDDYGDFSKELVKYLYNKQVNVLGTVPTFLNNTKHLCKWVDINAYPTIFAKCALQSKFIIAPLADNLFNRCKSDLKYLESAAIGRVCLCSNVGEYNKIAHPYQIIPNDADFNKIQYIVNRADTHYDEIIKWQYDKLKERWLDYKLYLNLFETEEQ